MPLNNEDLARGLVEINPQKRTMVNVVVGV